MQANDGKQIPDRGDQCRTKKLPHIKRNSKQGERQFPKQKTTFGNNIQQKAEYSRYERSHSVHQQENQTTEF